MSLANDGTIKNAKQMQQHQKKERKYVDSDQMTYGAGRHGRERGKRLKGNCPAKDGPLTIEHTDRTINQQVGNGISGISR